MIRSQRTTNSEEFKLQMLELYNNGRPANEIAIEFDLSASSIHNWVRQYKKNGIVQIESNMTLEVKEIIAKNKRIRQLEMENDILKRAKLSMGKKQNIQKTIHIKIL